MSAPATPCTLPVSRPFRAGAAALCCALFTGCAQAPALANRLPEAASGWSEKPGWTARTWMVAAANPLAADAGYRILKAGGSALDAAIAVQMVLTLVEPQSSGIGGGAFLMHWDGRTVETYDGRETAPAAAGEALFLKDGQPMRFHDAAVGGRAVGTPGVLRMLEMAHRRHGRLPWRDLFEPAIQLAENGFAIGPRLAALLRSEPHLADDPAARAYFFDAAGRPKPAGTLLRNPELAAVLRDIGERGADAFHSGPLAREMVRKVRAHPNGGALDEADLAAYRAKVREALCFDYRAARVCGAPPPSSGALALGQIFGMLEGHDLAALKPERPGADGLWRLSPRAVHLYSEAARLAYADRAHYVADGDFVAVPLAGLLDRAYLELRWLRSSGQPPGWNKLRPVVE